MTQEQKRIKLAEAFGMTGWEEARALPDYFNDLNAVHDLRAKLTDRQREVFSHYLAYSELPDEGYIGYIELPPIDAFDVINSPADVQAEALGKTLNLW
jgi:hypothetical protein